MKTASVLAMALFGIWIAGCEGDGADAVSPDAMLTGDAGSIDAGGPGDSPRDAAGEGQPDADVADGSIEDLDAGTSQGAATDGGKEEPPFQTAFELVEAMQVGWNLGNSLDAWFTDLSYHENSTATETHWGNPATTRAMIDEVAAAGFKSIRIPVTYVNHMNASGLIDQVWLDRVEEVVGYALANGLYTIVNVHHDAGMQGWIYCDAQNYEPNEEALVNIWRQVAARFRDYDERLLFEATNEIVNPEHSWDWGLCWDDFRAVHDLSQAVIDTVRADGGKNASRHLVVSTFGASTDSEEIKQLFYKAFEDSIENHLIVSLHNYTKSLQSMPALMERLGAASRTYATPIILDEFGTTAADRLSTRLVVAATYVSEARKQGIATFVWDNGGDFALFDRSNLNWRYLSIKEALVGASEADQVPAQTIQVVKDRAPAATYSQALSPGAAHTIMPFLLPRNAYTEVPAWTTSNSAICTVDDGGKVTAVAPGTAVVTGTIANGNSVEVTFTVE